MEVPRQHKHWSACASCALLHAQVAFVEMPKFNFDLNVYGGDGALLNLNAALPFSPGVLGKHLQANPAGWHHGRKIYLTCGCPPFFFALCTRRLE